VPPPWVSSPPWALTAGSLIPQSFGLSTRVTGGLQAALISFIAFYGSCMVLTWWCYLRTGVATDRIPSLAWARP
jgi:NNP family nitrate/nitrite transporter-like MFS transporter